MAFLNMAKAEYDKLRVRTPRRPESINMHTNTILFSILLKGDELALQGLVVLERQKASCQIDCRKQSSL